MDYKIGMKKANCLWQHWIVNDILLLNASTFTKYDDTSSLLFTQLFSLINLLLLYVFNFLLFFQWHF